MFDSLTLKDDNVFLDQHDLIFSSCKVLINSILALKANNNLLKYIKFLFTMIETNLDPIQHVGLVGLGVMGANLARNLASRQFQVAVFNRTYHKTKKFIENYADLNLIPYENLEELIRSLPRPRKIILMVQSGPAVDDLIAKVMPWLEDGDILIDCGNSNWKDTERRQLKLSNIQEKQVYFVGCGISGGEEGALRGPSIMPGGDSRAIVALMPVLKAIAAKDFDGGDCVTNVGSGGAGHFVKMVHNGIEYGMMQIIAEIYDIIRRFEISNHEMQAIFRQLNSGRCKSYLLDITLPILSSQDPKTGQNLLDLIVPRAGAKGTGTWTVQSALELGVPVPTLAAAVFARQHSNRSYGFKTYSAKSEIVPSSGGDAAVDLEQLVIECQAVLEACFQCCYFQGIELIAKANLEFSWGIDLAEVTRIWEGGCIIRSEMLRDLAGYWDTKSDMTVGGGSFQIFFAEQMAIHRSGTPKLAINSCFDYVRTIFSSNLPQNLTQAQRDFFGAHTYLRTDQPGVFTGGWDTLE